MMPFDSSARLNAMQQALATRAMLAIAHVDPANIEEEVALIRAFFEDVTQGEAKASFDELLADARKPVSLSAEMFPDPVQKDLVVGSCLMVAYADGTLSQAERAAVESVAQQIGMSGERLSQLVEIVQDHLLAQLSGLPDAQSVVKVGQEL
ncbi:MAG: TerB family tellurite resistance protein [Candidatus Methylophosphatis roskildensis]